LDRDAQASNQLTYSTNSDHDDYKKYPMQPAVLKWEELNQDLHSNIRDYRDIETIASQNGDKELDLRPYMIERPYTVSIHDKFPKILNIFR
jgi:hypothetical protein